MNEVKATATEQPKKTKIQQNALCSNSPLPMDKKPQPPEKNPTIPPLTLPIILWLGFTINRRPQSLKPLATALEVANGAIKVPKLLHSPSPDSILFLSKTLFKTYNAAKRILPTPKIPSQTVKQFKAWLGAVNLIRYAGYSVSGCGDGFGFLKYGYKLSKNFVKVGEGLVGLQIDSALRSWVDALGMVVKAVVVGREVRKWIESEPWTWVWGVSSVSIGVVRIGGPRGCLRCELLGFGCCGEVVRVDGIVDKVEGDVVSEMDVEVCVSDLLCLSIPLHWVIAVGPVFDTC